MPTRLRDTPCHTARRTGSQGGIEKEKTKTAMTYVEPASSFWILNPNTKLIGNARIESGLLSAMRYEFGGGTVPARLPGPPSTRLHLRGGKGCSVL